MIFLSTIFLIAALGLLLYWIVVGRFFVHTSDAYVHGNQVMLTPEISGSVTAIYTDNTDLVEKGQLVVMLDSTDYRLTIEEKRAVLGASAKTVAQLFETVKQREAQVVLQKAELRQMELDFAHREGLIKTHAVSVEEYEQAQTNVVTAQASVILAEREWESARLAVEGTTVFTHPLVKEAVQELREAYLNLIRCRVLAPVTGYVAKRSVQVGDRVMQGDTLLMIVPLEDLWVEANYKETKLAGVRIGQPVTYWSDIYGRGVKFHGKVVGFSAGTGDAFSLLPPQNATGNWIKIVQRLPIRVSISSKELKRHPLMIGLSLHVDTDVSDTSGEMLSQVPTEKQVYSTPIFDREFQLKALDPFIEEVIRVNTA